MLCRTAYDAIGRPTCLVADERLDGAMLEPRRNSSKQRKRMALRFPVGVREHSTMYNRARNRSVLNPSVLDAASGLALNPSLAFGLQAPVRILLNSSPSLRTFPPRFEPCWDIEC